MLVGRHVAWDRREELAAHLLRIRASGHVPHEGAADASNWAGVIPTLQAAGVDVLAPANPLCGINHDAAYIASVASQIPGPVLLVGHSYGGTGERCGECNGPAVRIGPSLRPVPRHGREPYEL